MKSVAQLCAVWSLLFAFAAHVAGEDWPQWRGPQRDGVWREDGVVDRLPEKLHFRWKTDIGSGFAGPAVVGNHVYVADRVVATGENVPESRWNVTDPVRGDERVVALDAGSGEIVWTHRYPCRYEISYPAGPRATPTVSDGKVYSVGAMGNLVCLDAEDGRLIWSKNYVRDFGTRINPWGMASSPLVDGRKLIVLAGGKPDACVVAMDKNTGQEIWRNLEVDDPGYSSPIVIQAGGVRQLIVWNSVGLYSLDPETGREYWHEPFETKMAHSIATPVYDVARRLLFVSSFFDGPLMMRLADGEPTAEVLWRGYSHSELPQNTDKLHTLMSTAALVDGYLYGVDSYGPLRCLDAMTGERVWETLEATGEARWSTAFLVRHADRFFLFNEHGELILADLSPDGYHEIDRVQLIKPTAKVGRRMVVWSHPAFADRAVYVRNDRQIVCAELGKKR